MLQYRGERQTMAFLAVLLGLLPLVVALPVAAQDGSGYVATPFAGPPDAVGSPLVQGIHPRPGQTIASGTPRIEAHYNGTPDRATVRFVLDGLDLAQGDDSSVLIGEHNLTYQVPDVLALKPGNHTVRVEFGDDRYTWRFKVDPNFREASDEGTNTLLIVVVGVGGLVAAVGVGVGATYLYLRKAKGYSWEKFTVKFPVRREHVVLYLPLFLATLGLLGGLSFAATHPWRYSTEHVIVAALTLGLGPYAIDVRRAKRRKRSHEKAFTQFLYELADSMRGGIDPYKAIQELARTDNSILKKALGAASDSIRLGRPLDVVMRNLGRPSKSSLVERYAALVGEASSAGGEVASVVYRAAKDMDELLRIERDRSAKMAGPVVTIYISFGVLLMITQSMLSFAPALADFGAPQPGGENVGAELLSFGSADVPKMSLPAMQLTFFHVLLANALGAGLLVGSFIEGKVRHGLVHALILLGIAATAFPALAR